MKIKTVMSTINIKLKCEKLSKILWYLSSVLKLQNLILTLAGSKHFARTSKIMTHQTRPAWVIETFCYGGLLVNYTRCTCTCIQLPI